MVRYTVAERTFIVESYLSGKPIRLIQAECLARFGKQPTDKSIRRLVQKFKDRGNLEDNNRERSGRRRTQRTDANIERVAQHFQNNPKCSIRKGAAILNMKKTTVHRIVKENLNLFPYKTQIQLKLTDESKQRRLQFGQQFMTNLLGILGSIWFTDESIFTLNPHLNKQNNRTWQTKGDNPCESVTHQYHPQKLMVWAAISSNGIVVLPIRENTITSESYRRMLEDDFIPFLMENGILEESWFQQDGARAHTSDMVLEFLMDHFEDRIISNR